MLDRPRIEFETRRLRVRSLEEVDKDDYMALCIETSESTGLFQDPVYYEQVWKDVLATRRTLCLSVFHIGTGDYVASASVQNYMKNAVDIGFDVVADYRN